MADASHKSKREVEELIARRFPRPDVATSIRKVPERRPVVPMLEAGPSAVVRDPRAESGAGSRISASPASASPAARPTVQPLAEDRYLIKFTASQATLAKLRRAQDLLRHAVPSGDAAEIFDRALTALVKELEKQKLAATDRLRASGGMKDASRTVPAEVRRAVWARDEGQCAFVGAGNRRCDATAFLEFHHCSPYAAGGEATVSNIALRCRAHNQYEADLFFGPIRKDRDAWHSIRPGAD